MSLLAATGFAGQRTKRRTARPRASMRSTGISIRWHTRNAISTSSCKGEARAEVDTATKLDKMSQAMRERADQLQKVAQDTRTFEGLLSPEQKTIFDLYWKTQFHQLA